jgi:phenylpropionate dioxygenase-like ring-hydroxylating dioxygenase large terminal subunit
VDLRAGVASVREDEPTAPRYLLPPAAYTSDAWWEHEQEALFTNQWALVGSVDELAEPGDYVTATIGHAPLVVLRGPSGELAAFHNLCRHRGMVLLEGAGHVSGTIKCFYHQWRYALDGALVAVPQRREQFPDLDAACLGLLPASVATWEGMVFAHPDPAAAPLADRLGEVPASIGGFRPGLLRQVATARLDAACNWKLFVENHVDVYHLWYLHETTLGDYDHNKFEHHQLGPNWVSYEPLRNHVVERGAPRRGTTEISHLTERDRLGIGAHLVFPNLMIATEAEFWVTYVAVPLAPDRTVIDIRIRAEDDADPARLLAAVRSFIEEDISACEAVQAALRSPIFAVGPLAREHEAPITEFQTHVLAAMEGTP